MASNKRIIELGKADTGGGSVLMKWQKKQASYFALVGDKKQLQLYSRQGENIAQYKLSSHATAIEWSRNGDYVAVTLAKKSHVIILNVNNMFFQEVESGFRDQLSSISWSLVSNVLAIGTSKGNLMLYDPDSDQKTPLLGKLSKKITSIIWSRDNLLALASDDGKLSINEANGDTMKELSISKGITNLKFGNMKGSEPSNYRDNTIAMSCGKSLFFLNLNELDHPVEMNFQEKYGNIVNYHWYGDGYIVMGFEKGSFLVISTHPSEIEKERYTSKNHQNYLADVAICKELEKAATCGDHCITINNLNDNVMSGLVEIDQYQPVTEMNWSDDGSMMSITTTDGIVVVFLMKMPQIHSTYNLTMAYLTSLREVTINNAIIPQMDIKIETPFEPQTIGVSQLFLTIGFNNRIWFYGASEDNNYTKLYEKEYLNSVRKIRMNDQYIAVLMEKQVQIHGNDERYEEHENVATAIIPADLNEGNSATDIDMNSSYVAISQMNGEIKYFLLRNWSESIAFKHSLMVKRIFIQPSGSLAAFIDKSNDGFILNPIRHTIIEIPELPPKCQGILWEVYNKESEIFVAWDEETVTTYLYCEETVRGTMCLIIHRSPLTYNSSPLLLQMGMLKLIDTNAKMLTQQLESHDVQTLDDGTSLDAEDIEPIRMSISRLCQIKRFNDAAKLALFINHPIEQNKIGTLALFHFEVEFAIDFYLSIGDASMVNALKQIVHIDERNLLAARIAVLLEDFDLAQDYFMKSSYKIGALELRKDLLQWESALKLAKILNPSDLPYISRSYATQLEAHGDIPAAYKFYEKGITKRSDDREHDEYCAGGIARCALRIGDFRRGIGLCLKLPSKQLKRDCAAILAKMKKFAEAGEIYEKAEAWDKAAECYIHSKNWNGVGQLLNKITSPRIHYLYGEAREREGHYDEAFQAYLHANEDEQAVRIQLDYLNNPEKAGEIVQRKMNTDAARRVAKYYEERKDYPSALKFLIFSRKNEEAFNLAKKNHRMDDLSELILDHGSRDDYFSIALYFEQQNRNYQSGKFYYYAEEYDKAVDHLLKNDPKHQDEAIEFAIKAVGASQNPHLADVVLQYLEGVIDGTPKPTKYKFLLYSALHRYSEAAEAAVLIGREDMNDGQYKMAHDVLRTMYQTLKQQRIHVPREMVNNLSLLHSYRLAKLHAKKGNHLIAARLLDRVSKNISKFEQHSVQIMTSTVIECSKVGLKDTALKYAAILVRPENKKHIDQRFQRKIETLVRRPEKGDIPMEKSNCPICSYPLGDYELLCNECQSSIPYCIASGKHILNSDLTVCPQCDFPAIYSHFVPLLTTDHECPMCNGIIDIRMVKQIDDQELIRHIISPDVENESSN